MNDVSNLNNLSFKSNKFTKVYTIVLMFVMLFSLLVLPKTNVKAAGLYDVNVYVFAQDGCPKCASLKVYLNELAEENDHITVWCVAAR